jgi:hypothetical protein
MWERKAWVDAPLGPDWDDVFADWIERFGLERVADAVQMASIARISKDGRRSPPDIRDIPKYAAVEMAEDREPGMRACHFVRGRMRLKFYCAENDNEVLSLLMRAMRAGVSEPAMNDIVDDSSTLEDCFAAMGIDKTEFRTAMKHPIVDPLPRNTVFIATEDREWPIWNAHLRKTTGKDAPINKRGGWYFPSRLPPSDPPRRRSKKADRK